MYTKTRECSWPSSSLARAKRTGDCILGLFWGNIYLHSDGHWWFREFPRTVALFIFMWKINHVLFSHILQIKSWNLDEDSSSVLLANVLISLVAIANFLLYFSLSEFQSYPFLVRGYSSALCTAISCFPLFSFVFTCFHLPNPFYSPLCTFHAWLKWLLLLMLFDAISHKSNFASFFDLKQTEQLTQC